MRSFEAERNDGGAGEILEPLTGRHALFLSTLNAAPQARSICEKLNDYVRAISRQCIVHDPVGFDCFSTFASEIEKTC